jgi:sulfite dehydrogenase (cytochrome) subunit B
MKKILLIISVVTLLTPTLAPAQTQAAATGSKSIVLPPETVNLKSAKGLDVVQANCLICHSGDYISMQPPFTKAQWTAEVQKMVKVMGAKITEANAVIISDYLAENYGSRK